MLSILILSHCFHPTMTDFPAIVIARLLPFFCNWISKLTMPHLYYGREMWKNICWRINRIHLAHWLSLRFSVCSLRLQYKIDKTLEELLKSSMLYYSVAAAHESVYQILIVMLHCWLLLPRLLPMFHRLLLLILLFDRQCPRQIPVASSVRHSESEKWAHRRCPHTKCNHSSTLLYFPHLPR